MNVIILDLDNTIADDSWRISRINWQHENPERRYHDYHSLSAWDKPGNVELFSDLRSDQKIAIFTARPVAYRAITEEWLKRNGVPASILIMRNPEDVRHSKHLKRSHLHWLLAYYDIRYEDIEAAYDDREDVVEMYREFGIKAEVKFIHDICAYTNPNNKDQK